MDGRYIFLGFVCGLAVSLLFWAARAPDLTENAASPSPAAAPMKVLSADPAELQTRASAFSHRLAIHARVADLQDVQLLTSTIDAALQPPLHHFAAVEAEALLGSLFEINPEEALSYVRSNDVPRAVLASTFRSWAQIDARKAALLLGEIADPAKERLLASALIEVAGVDVIDLLVMEGRTLAYDGLLMTALADRATADVPDALLGVAILASSDAQEFAITAIGRRAALLDPDAAIAAAESIDDSVLRRAYMEALYTQWSLADLPGLLTHLKTLYSGGHHPSTFERALLFAAESDPRAVLEFGNEVGGRLGVAAEAAAVGALAASDPEVAIRHHASLADGARRDKLAASIATGYARYNSHAALEWATGLKPPSQSARRAVMAVIAEESLVDAVRIELANPDSTTGAVVGSPIIPAWFEQRFTSDFNDPQAIVDMIAGSEETGLWKERMLSTALARWAVKDIDSALAWMSGRSGDLPVSALRLMADQIPPTDAERLLSLSDMLPPERRPEWIEHALRMVSQADPRLAVAAAERYRDTPYHENLIAGVIRTAVDRWGPEAAAELTAAFPNATTVAPLAVRWARRNPSQALEWAASLPDERLREVAVTEVLTTWARTDADAAMERVQRIPVPLGEQAMKQVCRRVTELVSCD